MGITKKPGFWTRLRHWLRGKQSALPVQPAEDGPLALRIAAAVDLPGDRQLLRRFASELGWSITFLSDIDMARTCGSRAAKVGHDAAVLMPATAQRALDVLASDFPPGDLPVLFVGPADLSRAELERAKSVYAWVEAVPLFQSTFRLAILRIIRPRG